MLRGDQHESHTLVDVEIDISGRSQAFHAGPRLIQAAGPDKPPRRFRSEVDEGNEHDWPKPSVRICQRGHGGVLRKSRLTAEQRGFDKTIGHCG